MAESHAPIGEVVVCPTPIGNLGDITLRALEALRDADVIACEDTRRTGALLRRLDLSREGRRLLSLHEHNDRQRAGQLLDAAERGAKVVLVSDAGMPLVSDPGFALLAGALARGVPVAVLPGPSALTAALVASGLPPTGFQFDGFLPRDRAALRELLARNERTLVAFESPKRLAATLAALAELDGERPVAVCRELTKLHEEVVRGPAAEIAARLAEGEVRGEVVLVVGAAPRSGPALAGCGPARAHGGPVLEQAGDAVGELIASGARPRVAARVVARLIGASANELYELGVDRADSLRRR